MPIDIKVPTVGESINEVTLVKWLKKEGEWAERDEVIAELESEKATFEINAEQAGLVKQVAKEGDTLAIGDLVGSIDTEAPAPEKKIAATASAEPQKAIIADKIPTETSKPAADIKATPVAAAIIADKKVDSRNITASGSNGKIIKQDVLEALNNPGRIPGADYSAGMTGPKK